MSKKVLRIILVVAFFLIAVGVICICYNEFLVDENSDVDTNYNDDSNNNSMSDLIDDARKDTFITTAFQYCNEVRMNFIMGDYDSFGNPSNGECLVVTTDSTELNDSEPFGYPIANNSYVIIYNNNNSYEYYIQLIDEAGNGFGVYEENSLTSDLIVERNARLEDNYQDISIGSNVDLGNSNCVVMGVVN